MIRFKINKTYTDEDIVAGCQSGNATMQKLLYERYSRKMYAVCLRYTSNRFEAEDSMIIGFSKVFEKITHFKSEGSLEGWIRKIMVNEALTMLRKQHILFSSSETTEVENVANPAWNTIETDELLNMINQLPAGYRTVFNLYAIEGYSHDEIAKLLNISESTSKSQLSRARAALQQQLQQEISAINLTQAKKSKI